MLTQETESTIQQVKAGLVTTIIDLHFGRGLEGKVIAEELGLSVKYVRQVIRSFYKSTKTKKTNTRNKESDSRREEMFKLRFDEKMSLAQIGERYGVSRERVRQIIGNTGQHNGGFNYSKFMDTLRDPDWVEKTLELSNSEIAEKLGIDEDQVSKYRAGSRHGLKEGSPIAEGARWEEWVSQTLTDLGVENELMPISHPFDILAGKIRVEVKSTRSLMQSPSQQATYYRWNIAGDKPGKERRMQSADFFVLVIEKTDDVFVIPQSELPPSGAVVFSWPPKRDHNKYARYHNAWHLIALAASD